MAIKQLTEEQVRTMTLEEKDRWWLQNVFRGDMPQLTIRSALTGFMLGGILSATNLYIGAKTGWSLGVGITSVILAFAFFKVMQRLQIAKEFTILENNAMQSIATSAGYMTSPLISSLAAYMVVDGRLLPWTQIFFWNVVVSILGVLFAFPMKRRFINDEQHPFPEGRACGVVMDTLHTTDASEGLRKAKVLIWAAGLAGGIKFIQAEAIQEWIQFRLLRLHGSLQGQIHDLQAQVRGLTDSLKTTAAEQTAAVQQQIAEKGAALGDLRDQLHEKLLFLPEQLDVLAVKLGIPIPRIANIDVRQLTITPALDLALAGAGGLMGIRAAFSLMLGSVLNYFVLAPIMAVRGDIVPVRGSIEAGTAVFGLRAVTLWSLWPGVACMVVASFVAFFAKPQLIIGAFSGLLGRKSKSDVLKHIEFPLWISIVGVPIVSVVAAFMAQAFFGVNPWLCLLGLPLAFILCLVAANSTALTGTTPVGATAKITQLFYGVAAPGNKTTNLATASLTAEVVSNSSNLLMDIKPGYMLGAKPRQQAVGHIIGIFAGAIASTPLFFLLFTKGVDTTSDETVRATIGNLQSDKFPMPSVTVWKAVADVLAEGLSRLAPSVITAVIVASIVGLVLEIGRIASRGKFPISPVALGLAFVINFQSALAMFAGALFFWLMGVGRKRPEGQPANVFVDQHEPICAGVIAGAAIIGIIDAIFAAFVIA